MITIILLTCLKNLSHLFKKAVKLIPFSIACGLLLGENKMFFFSFSRQISPDQKICFFSLYKNLLPISSVFKNIDSTNVVNEPSVFLVCV